MCQPVVPVIHAVNTAFQYFIAAAKLLRALRHAGLRFDQAQFPFAIAHERGPEPTGDWMLQMRC